MRLSTASAAASQRRAISAAPAASMAQGWNKSRSRAASSSFAITIAPDVVDPSDIETLQDLIVAAITDASQKAQALSEQRMGPLAGGMKLPGLF